jgi:hypothetical protein
MNCFYCHQQHPGGTRFGARAAVGVCRRCGVGVCPEHSHRDQAPGSELLCHECAKLELAFPLQVKGGVRAPIAGNR